MKNNKRVLIVTLPLGKNYGGILQAYALQKAVELKASTVVTGYPKMTHLDWVLGSIKDILIRLKGGHRESRQNPGAELYITQYTKDFIMKNMNTVEMKGYSLDQNSHYGKEYDYFIAGSDQVWRGSRALKFYMLGFSSDPAKTRFSYAASFGVEDPGFSSDTVHGAGRHIKTMRAVSVREVAAIKTIQNYWNITAERHVDPTLLLGREEYSRLIDSATTVKIDGKLFVYVLDRSEKNEKIINYIEEKTSNRRFEILPKEYSGLRSFRKNKSAHIMPPVEQWLRSFRDADYVVTDSFHGTVFSIIFNKPFIAIGNKSRGLARFISLLENFNLSSRLITSAEDLREDLVAADIDWQGVNEVINDERLKSMRYLGENLR